MREKIGKKVAERVNGEGYMSRFGAYGKISEKIGKKVAERVNGEGYMTRFGAQ
jgi:hypothetical protein